MLTQDIHFILVPDTGAARRARRMIASRSARLGVVCGTWPDLIRAVSEVRGLAREAHDRWRVRLYGAASSLPGAFWEKTLKAAPADTLNILERAYALYLALPESDEGVQSLIHHQDMPSRRLARNLGDLGRLHSELGGRMSPDYELMRQIVDGARPNRQFRVYREDMFPPLDAWQARVVERLNADADAMGAACIADCAQVLAEIANPAPRARPGSDLRFMQTALYAHRGAPRAVCGDAQWLCVRDSREEVEVAASMIGEMLCAHPDWGFGDVGLVLPPLPEYTEAVRNVFSNAGIPLSGLPDAMAMRDVGQEAVSLFVGTREKPAAAMAEAALLCSPLMPWRREVGRRLAQRRMEGALEVGDDEVSEAHAIAMMNLLNRPIREPWQLAAALREFADLMACDGELAPHAERARAAVGRILPLIESSAQIDWGLVRALVRPEHLTTPEPVEYGIEGVTCVMEGYEAWRPVRHLIVMGFRDTHYPVEVAQSQVFQPEDMRFLERFANIKTHSRAIMLSAFRQRLRRQICAASEGILFMMPMMSTRGERLSASESMVFMRHMFSPEQGRGDIVVNVDSAEDRMRTRYLAVKAQNAPQWPKALSGEDVHLNTNLLLRGGEISQESPTSLETLVVSPLAWTLRRLGLRPLLWEPESLNGRIIGRLTHDAFKQLFAPSKPLPDDAEMEKRVEGALLLAAREDMGFIRGSEWLLERGYLVSEICRAAHVWARLIRESGARIIGAETQLSGFYGQVPVSGVADLLLAMPDARLMVFDYKKSRHERWAARMEKGFDIQTPLYRLMVGSPQSQRNVPGLAEFGAQALSALTGVGYYTLNDQNVVSDQEAPYGVHASWTTLDGDISGEALALIDQRLEQVSQGLIELNSRGDEALIEEVTGIRPYALDNSPLIRLFMKNQTVAE